MARRRSGLTQGELAARAGMRQQVVSRIELGLAMPRVGTLDRLLRACGEGLATGRRPGAGIDREAIGQLLGVASRNRLPRPFIRSLDVMAARRVGCVLVGDAAARLYGAPVRAEGLELVVDPDPDNLRRLAAALRHPWVQTAILHSGGPFERLLGLAEVIPWRPIPPPRRVLNRIINDPTAFVAALEDLIEMASPDRRAILLAVLEEREARRR